MCTASRRSQGKQANKQAWTGHHLALGKTALAHRRNLLVGLQRLLVLLPMVQLPLQRLLQPADAAVASLLFHPPWYFAAPQPVPDPMKFLKLTSTRWTKFRQSKAYCYCVDQLLQR